MSERPELRVTLRCLSEDLALGVDPAQAIQEIDHPLVRAFVSKRSQRPEGDEKLEPLNARRIVYTLHGGRWRGATWHDREHNVVWLLGGGYHRSGEADDVYPTLKGIEASGRLLPSEEDYELLFRSRIRTFVDAVVDEIPELINKARTQTPAEIGRILGGTVRVCVVVVPEEGGETIWLAISMRLEQGGLRPPPDWISVILAAFFSWVEDPHFEIDSVDDVNGRRRNDDELVWMGLREN